jgi:ribosomal protein L7Ae-like RNA K-turn-binding protein
MQDAARRKVLALIGLGVRARNVVVGVEQVRGAAQRGRLALAVIASDVSPNSRDKVLPLLKAKGIECLEGPTGNELGQCVGKQITAVVGVSDSALANGIRAALAARTVVEEEV